MLAIPLGLSILGLAAYDDLFTLKIRNGFVVLGVAAGICVQGAAAAIGLTAPHDLSMAALNAGVALAAGAAFWHFGLWSAGDAKLFAAAVLLLPPSLYHARGAWLPAFILLVNASAFVLVAATYWFLKGLLTRFRGPRREAVSVVRAQPSAPDSASSALSTPKPPLDSASTTLSTQHSALNMVCATFVGFVMILILGRAANEQVGRLLGGAQASGIGLYLVLFILMRHVSALFRRRPVFWTGVVVVAAVVVWTAATRGAAGLLSLVDIGWISAALMVFRVLYDRLVRDLDEKTIAAGELRPAMIIAPSAVERLGIRDIVKDTDVGTLLPDGLTDAQVRDITAALVARGVREMQVSRTAPFAPFLLLGFLLTAWFGKTVLQIH
jgi:Flp pilus assembly protein protease CpaA/prepilin signal peptidase PulO-like enzyme (type II secretory pathway)